MNRNSKNLYLYSELSNHIVVNTGTMKKTSILLLIVGIIVTIGLIIYFRSEVNPVDSDSMTIDRSGGQVSKWPLFIGIILTFVGCVFYYVSHTERKVNK